MKRSSCGLLNVFEDVCPLSDDTALLVTGVDYMHHTEIREARYHLEGDEVVIDSSRLVREGTHLRLGNVHTGSLVFSDAGVIHGGPKAPRSGYAEQPFLTDDGLYYTRDSEVWLDDAKLVGRFDGYDEVCHPTADGHLIYFEAKRIDPAFPGSAKDWQVLRYHLDTGVSELVLRHGANPYVFGRRLFHSRWSDRKRGFETVAIPLPEVLPEALPESVLRGAA
jgi:hypothetical protein